MGITNIFIAFLSKLFFFISGSISSKCDGQETYSESSERSKSRSWGGRKGIGWHRGQGQYSKSLEGQCKVNGILYRSIEGQ